MSTSSQHTPFDMILDALAMYKHALHLLTSFHIQLAQPVLPVAITVVFVFPFLFHDYVHL